MEKVSPLDHIAGMVGSAIQWPWFGQMYSGRGWVSYTVAMVWSEYSGHGWFSHAVAMVESGIQWLY